ncbi:MAG: nuclear transport factor 2 family protein [Bryobacterales bacterium]|nr:nuclear transport factor 2 family protein [Bryobacterales bacterium]
MLQTLAVCLLVVPVAVYAQPPKPDELHDTIADLDKALFDAYNSCDLERFANFFAGDIEFYHDNDGLSTGKQKLVDAVKRNICGKVRRALVPGTLEVYPLRNFGAVETGIHRFYHPGADDRQPAGEAKFIHLWQYKDGAWKVTRVISYDHKPLPK